MLRIVNLEEIEGLLLRIPKLVDRLEQQDPEFIQEVKRWLITLEQVLMNNRMPVGGSIAALRAVLNTSEHGVIPAGIVFNGKPTSRKIGNATAADVLRRTSELVSNALREDSSRIAEAERLGQQLLAIARSKGLTLVEISAGEPIQNIKKLWRTISADSNLSPGAVRLESLIGRDDALIVLDRVITAGHYDLNPA